MGSFLFQSNKYAILYKDYLNYFMSLEKRLASIREDWKAFKNKGDIETEQEHPGLQKLPTTQQLMSITDVIVE